MTRSFAFHGSFALRALAAAGALLLAAATSCRCQGGDAHHDMIPFYALDVLPELHIQLDADAFAKLEKEPRKFVRGAFVHDGVTYRDVGVRLKGHRSMRELDDKPAFKLRFDKYDRDRRFLGQKRLTLNNMVEDPTLVREVLGYRLYREAGVHAPHAAYATVYLNGERKGLYAIIETIDDVFLADRFPSGAGDLYEGEYGCDLYADDVPGFDHEQGADESRADLASFAGAAAGPAGQLFGPGSPIDVDDFLSYLAVSAFIGDFDGYRHSHNYRIYREPGSGRWFFIPWGIDRVFKRHMPLYDSEGLLAKRCFADAACRPKYLREMRRVLEHFDGLNLDQGVAVVSAFIDEAARADPHLDRGEIDRRRAELLTYLAERPARVREALACLDPAGDEIDRDGDGFGCMDCDDDDPAIHPGAAEVCDDVDNDCSGLADDAAECPCPSQELVGTAFHFCDLPMTWADADQFCAAQGGRLARITSEVQSKAVYRAARRYNEDRWWIGYSDREDEGNFTWRDGQPGEFTYWAKGEPDNDACNQDCAALKDGGKGRWHDTHCAQLRPFVCTPLPAPPLEPGRGR